MATTTPDTYTGYVCECCIVAHVNGDECMCDTPHAMADWIGPGYERISLDWDGEDGGHFGQSCIGCGSTAPLWGHRYDATITVH